MSSVQLEKAGDQLIHISGELSFATVAGSADALTPLLEDTANPVLDLAGVTRSDSAGVALLLEWQRQAMHLGKVLKFENAPDQILAISRVSGVDALLSLDAVGQNNH